MEKTTVEKVQTLLKNLIPQGTEIEVQAYYFPCLNGSRPIQQNYIVRLIFPYKLTQPLKRPSNSFCVTYRTETLNISKDRWKIIIGDLVAQENSQRTAIRLRLEAARRRQFLSGIDNIRVSGESTRSDIKVKEILF